MDLYLVSLGTGAVGLGVMAIGGLSHGGHAGHAGHAAHGNGGHDAHVGHAHGSSHTHHGEQSSSSGWNWTSFFSPRILFAAMVGFGAGGIAAAPLGEPWQFGAAILAGFAFEAFLVGPIWRFLFRFESRPAATLESSIEDDARAVTGFDASGCGLVAVDVDGQIIQLLATLTPDDLTRGVRVRTGDLVKISEVDAARGRCTVTTSR